MPPYRLPVYAACTLLSLICNYLLGKDMAWDTLNYHLYSGFSALNDRFAQDYFAAGVLSYFNPFAYVPFYLLVHAGLSALVISSLFAVIHSALLWITFELAIAIWPSNNGRTNALIGVSAAVLALMNPIYLQQAGSCFADITTAELVLAGWLLLVGDIQASKTIRVVGAGLLLGAASALKMSNAIPAVASIVLVLGMPCAPSERTRKFIALCASLTSGFAVVAAPWSFRLWKMFGNPFFPIFNNVFRSPEYTTAAQAHARFMPHGLVEALWRPMAIVDPSRMVHEELSAPDLRYAILEILIAALLVRWIWRSARGVPGMPVHTPQLSRALIVLACGFSMTWVLWLSGSGNSRYFLSMACVAGVIALGMLFTLLSNRTKARNYTLVAIFIVQAVQLHLGAEFRWRPAPWRGQWFAVDAPARLLSEPNLYLTIGAQSNSFIIPFLAADSGFINFSGGYSLAEEGPTGTRVKNLIRRYAPHVRMLIAGAKLYPDSDHRAPRRSQVDGALERFGLRTDTGDCLTIAIHNLPADLEIAYETSTPAAPRSIDTTLLQSCHVIPSTVDQATIARRRSADIVLDRLEDACPELFSPRRPVTEHDGDGWHRVYTNTDLTAWLSYGWVKFMNPVTGGKLIFVGREAAWANGALHLDCGIRAGIAYARLLDSQQTP